MNDSINMALQKHAVAADWDYKELAQILHEWAERFNHEFGLRVETPAIQFECFRRSRIAHYREGRNGFGLRHEIAFNILHLHRSLPEILETLLHELLHEWQEQHGRAGRGNYHNRQFREKAKYFGLLIDQRGCSLGVRPGRFTELLERYELDTSDFLKAIEIPMPLHQPGNSKLKKWSCLCTNVRAAVELEARCLKCGQLFTPAEPAW